MTRYYARTLHGIRALASAPINVGPNISIVGAIRLGEGVCAAMTLEGAFDGKSFMSFISEILVPVLHVDDHVIMDNLGAHRVPELVEAIEAVGAHVHFLPPYSPDLNPIEPLWSNFKERLRAAAARTKAALDNAIADGLKLVGPNQILGWFKGCGYV